MEKNYQNQSKKNSDFIPLYNSFLMESLSSTTPVGALPQASVAVGLKLKPTGSPVLLVNVNLIRNYVIPKVHKGNVPLKVKPILSTIGSFHFSLSRWFVP